MRVSIIIPVLNEAAILGSFLEHVRRRAPEAELLVADGGSNDGAPEQARRLADRVLEAPRGRARQMNAGAAAASGEVLWFLHADSLLPEAPLQAIQEALRNPGTAGGCFRLRIAGPQPIFRVSDRLGNLGVDLFKIALGDHGIFCRREVFEAVGGYPDLPLLEDAEFYRALRRCGQVRQLRALITTSPRRYERHGPFRTTLLYALILGLYLARAPIPALEQIYSRLQ